MSENIINFDTDPSLDLIRTQIPEGKPDWTENIAFWMHDPGSGNLPVRTPGTHAAGPDFVGRAVVDFFVQRRNAGESIYRCEPRRSEK